MRDMITRRQRKKRDIEGKEMKNQESDAVEVEERGRKGVCRLHCVTVKKSKQECSLERKAETEREKGRWRRVREG